MFDVSTLHKTWTHADGDCNILAVETKELYTLLWGSVCRSSCVRVTVCLWERERLNVLISLASIKMLGCIRKNQVGYGLCAKARPCHLFSPCDRKTVASKNRFRDDGGGCWGRWWGGDTERKALTQYGRPLQSCVTFYNKPFVSVCASISSPVGAHLLMMSSAFPPLMWLNFSQSDCSLPRTRKLKSSHNPKWAATVVWQ